MTRTSTTAHAASEIAFYDDSQHDYEQFWTGRDYEHLSEIMAINRLLRGRHYLTAMDFGGGYGRLTPTLRDFADKVILTDPSTKQLEIAKKRLKNYHNVEFVITPKKDYVPAKDGAVDLLVMVRVSHHLTEPAKIFAEIHRVLSDGGEAVIEIANEAHFLNRLKYMARFSKVPLESVRIGQNANGVKDEIPFLNHNPKTIENLFLANHLNPVDKLSVSNLRQKILKQHMNLGHMLTIEKLSQAKLAKLNFGPSIFYLVKKEG